MRYFVTIGGEAFEVELSAAREGRTTARLWQEGRAGAERAIELRPIGAASPASRADEPRHLAVELDGACVDVRVEEDARGMHLTIAGVRHDVSVEDERERAAHLTAAAVPQGPIAVKSAMPGIVRAVLVKPGDPVQPGQPLVILEAMKMENELRAEHAGILREVKVAAGAAVDSGAELLVIDPPTTA